MTIRRTPAVHAVLVGGLLLAVLPGCIQTSVSESQRKLARFTQDLIAVRELLGRIDGPGTMANCYVDLEQCLDMAVESGEKVLAEEYRLSDSRIGKTEAERIHDEFERVLNDVMIEIDRVRGVRGGSRTFWSMAERRLAALGVACWEVAITVAEASVAPGGEPFLDVEAARDALWAATVRRDFLEDSIPGNVVTLELENAHRQDLSDILAHVRGRDRGLRTVNVWRPDETLCVYVAPVDDYPAFRARLELGTVVGEDPGRGFLRVDLGPTASPSPLLAGSVEGDGEERGNYGEESGEPVDDDRPFVLSSSDDRADEPEWMGASGRVAPEQIEECIAMLRSGDTSDCGIALRRLAVVRPADVASRELRKEIARALRDVTSTEEHPTILEGAIRGLVVWGGPYSAPILLDMFPSDSHLVNETLLEAFGELKDPAAAGRVAPRLGDSSYADEAYACLEAMGTVAEHALIAVAPSSDPDVCLAAIRLLGSGCGTEECLPILQKAMRSRNPEVRDAAGRAQREILGR